MATINLLTKTADKVQERLYKESVTQGLFSNQYSFVGAKTIEVLSVDVIPLTPYDNTLTDGTEGTIGKRFGSIIELGDTKTSYTMNDIVKYNIGFDTTTNTDQDNIKSASSIISRQDREIVVPYRDQYRLNKIAVGAGIQVTNITPDSIKRGNILETLLKNKAQLSNNYAPANKQVLFVGETAAVEMKLADQVIGVDKIAEAPIVNGVIGKLAGMQLRIVPDHYLPEGLAYLIVTLGSAWAPVKIRKSRVITDHPDFDGSVVQYLEYHDCFVNEARKNTILAAWTTSGPAA